MPYKRLSEQVRELTNPQRSDSFIKLFREAVREGKIEGAYLPERFTLPKAFTKRGTEGTYQRDAKEMLFDANAKFEKWFDQVNRDLAVSRRGSALKPTAENIEAGLVDFKALAAETRKKMQASYEKGQALGKGRAKSRK